MEYEVWKMTDRDRLIELIKKAKAQECYDLLFADIDTAIDMLRGEEYLADYLIANGIIVPPCKAGDTVYKTSILGEITELKVKGFDGEVITEPYNHISFSALNKTVFLTREDAERALRECEGR